ncbi:MAG: class I SAM-dependent methyltransferase, partial [Ktedonobacterales bacterium]
AYTNRVPYPDEVFSTLADLLETESDAMLDIGCWRGVLARPMLAFAGRVDAVDASAEMIAEGRGLPDGDSPRLRWLHARIEDAPLEPPYGLVTAGASLHWMEWDVVLPRLCDALTPEGALAIVDCHPLPEPWDDEMGAIIQHYSTNRGYRRLDLIHELESRELFVKYGARHTFPVPYTQTVAEVLAAYHSMSALTRARMGAENARAFDDAARAVFMRHAPDGVIHWQVSASIVYGRPLSAASARSDTPEAADSADED